MALSTVVTSRRGVVYDDRPKRYANTQDIQKSIDTIREFAGAPPKSCLYIRIPESALPQVYEEIPDACQPYFDHVTGNLTLIMAPTAVHNAFSLFFDNSIRREPRPQGFPLETEDLFHHVGDSHTKQLPRCPPNSQTPWSRIADGQVLVGQAQARKTTRLVYEVGHSQTDENLDGVVQDWMARSDEHLRVIIACYIDETSVKNQIWRRDVRAERNRLLALYGTQFAKEEAGLEELSPTHTKSTLHPITENLDSSDIGYPTGALDLDISDVGSPLSPPPRMNLSTPSAQTAMKLLSMNLKNQTPCTKKLRMR